MNASPQQLGGLDTAALAAIEQGAAPEPKHVTLTVRGTPAPKGSGRAILVRGRAMHVPSGSDVNARALKSWDVAVRDAAAAAIGQVDAPPFVGKALKLTVVFYMRRPSGHYTKKGKLKPSAPAFPISKPDWSKLVRATEDSMIGIVFDDDSRIAHAEVQKRWAAPGAEGATILVEELLPT